MKLRNGHFTFDTFDTFGDDGNTTLFQEDWKVSGYICFEDENDAGDFDFHVEFNADDSAAIRAIFERVIARRLAQIGRALTEYQEGA